jgi:hypothetical protein
MLRGYEEQSSSPPPKRPQTPEDDVGDGPHTPPTSPRPRTPTAVEMSWMPTGDLELEKIIMTPSRYTPDPEETRQQHPRSPQNAAELHRYLTQQRIGNNANYLINNH